MLADTDPIKPARVYGELRKMLDPDAVTIGDGGDFVSYAGKYLEPATPGIVAGPGTVRLPRHRPRVRDGRPGHLPGPAGLRAARRRRGRLLADGRRVAGAAEAAGGDGRSATTASGAWRSTRCRRCTATTWPPTCSPGCATTQVVAALGGAGETVAKAADLGPALRRAFDAGVPYLVNVLTDPADAYPRSANLA